MLDGKTNEPVDAVSLAVGDSTWISSTDKNGVARLQLPAGQVLVHYSHVGYKSGVVGVALDSAGTILRILLERVAIELTETVISVPATGREQGKSSISTTELDRYPSPTRDPLRFLKALPGVTSGNDFSALYNVNGGNYDQNLMYVNGVEINPPLQIRRGLAESFSILNPSLIDSMVFRAISFPVRLGDNLSSVVEAEYGLDAEELQADLEFSSTSQSLAIRGPLSTIIDVNSGVRHASLRRHTGGLQISGKFKPTFWDWQTLSQMSLSPVTQLKLYVALLRSDFEMRPRRILLRYNCSVLRHRRVCDEFQGRGSGLESFAYDINLFGVVLERVLAKGFVKIYANYLDNREREDTNLQYAVAPNDIVSTERFDTELLLERWEVGLLSTYGRDTSQWIAGIGSRRSRIDGEVDSFEEVVYDRGLFFSSARSVAVDRDNMDHFLHLQYRRESDARSVVSGIRLVRFGSTTKVLLMPRLSARYKANSSWAFTLAAGRHAQAPLYKEYLAAAKPSDLKLQKSDQIGGGVCYEISNTLNWRTEFYFRRQREMISYQLDDLRVTYSGENDSRGLTYGMNSNLRGQLNSLIGIASYGYLIAREDIAADGRGHIAGPTDQRHTLSTYVEDRMYLEYLKLPNLLYSRFHLRVLYGSGFPHTPKILQDSTAGAPLLIDGPTNSSRDRSYFRFDIGMTQALNVWNHTVHVRQEVANMFDQHNILGYTYLPSSSGAPVEVRKSLGRRVYDFRVTMKF